MYKGAITANMAMQPNTDIPFVTFFNDGKGTDIEEPGKPELITPGKIYKISAMLNLTNITAGNITARMLGDDLPLIEVAASATSGGTTEKHTLNLVNAVKALPAEDGRATISIQLDGACTVSNAVFIVE
ncbi:MAG: hypothetical protein MJ092_07055 [Lachnospiraceae bacterium]|nr:hypothetical protein [Lachnospiraceae bacterium]